jgi:hypothetical protein
MGSESRSGRDRRGHPRISCTPTSAVLRIESSAQLMRVRVLNVSGMGMGLCLDTLIEPGSKVRVALSETIVSGDICFCRPNQDQSYEAGLLITDVSAASRGLAPLEELAGMLPCSE